MSHDTDRSHPAIVVVMGVSGSGKSAVARRVAERLGSGFLDADTLHPVTNVQKMRVGTPLTDADRGPWLDAVALRMSEAARRGDGLVVACSALKRAYRDRLRRAAPGLALVWLTGPSPLIGERLRARTGHFMPAVLLESQLETLEPPTADERPVITDISPSPDAIAAWLDACLRGLHEGA